MTVPDWLLPRGVSRSLWEYAHDPQIARQDREHLADSQLAGFDQLLVERWLPATGKIVDLGCGPGRLAIPLAQRGCEVWGVDLSWEALRMVRERADSLGLTIPTVRANLCELDCLADQQFDHALLMFGTLGMVSGPTQRGDVLRHAARLLKPGGRLVLHVHNVWRHLFVPGKRWWLLRDRWRKLLGSDTAGDIHHDYRGIPGMYHHAFSWRELRVLLNETGFTILDHVAVQTRPDGRVTSPRVLVNVRAQGWVVLAERQ